MMLIDSLIAKELVFVSGKGGVGKTFTAAWLAKYSVSKGKKVLLVESGNISQLGAYFKQNVSLNKIAHIHDNLSISHIDFEGCLRDYLSIRLTNQSIRNAFISNTKMRSFLDAIPGLPEVMMLGRLYYSAAREKTYDLVIYDSPASGHFLNLMTTLDAMVDTGLTGPLIHQVNTITEYLSIEESCGAVLVTNPEELVINETFDFLPKLQEQSPVKIDGLVINRCFEHGIDESFEDKLGSNLYHYMTSKVHVRHTFQLQIEAELKHFSIPVLLKLRELGNSLPETFYEQAWMKSPQEVTNESAL